MVRTRKSKAQRQAWWRSLSPEQQDEYIERRQSRKAELRKSRSPVQPVGFEATGVNESNRAEWMALILLKNPWFQFGD